MAKDILSNLKPAEGSRKKTKRIGRGQGSGHGGTATRGHKGARARSGFTYQPWFEGGQMPLTRRIPKYGFRSRSREEVQIVNVETLERLVKAQKITGTEVTPALLYEAGAIAKKNVPVKILGDGQLTAKLEIRAHAFSKSAKQKIEAAGGTVTLLARTEASA